MSNTNSTNSRTKVIKTLIHIQNGLSLSNMLDGLLADVSHDDKSFVHNLLLTSLRHWHATARLLDSLADKPIDEVEVRTTIQVGITQLLYLETADHASIFETVESVKQLDFARASGLVNAILRKVAKNPNKYRKQCDKKHSLPNWLAKQLKQDWREQYDELCQGLRLSAPMFLRVNQRQSGVEAYSQQLEQLEISHEVMDLSVELGLDNQQQNDMFHVKPIRLETSSAVSQLPNFDAGMVSVQDAHASLAGGMVKMLTTAVVSHLCSFADNSTNEPVHILDACTAPSGKLAHCLELFNREQIVKIVQTKTGTDTDGMDKNGIDKVRWEHEETPSSFSLTSDGMEQIKFTAIDNEKKRLERSEQTLARLGLSDEAKLICADATDWQLEKNNPEQFDVILLDAPCTATGVIRRHPDITLLRQETDITQTVALQKNILENLWSQLKPTGYLIYATCSILKAENVEQMQSFLTRHDNAKEVKIDGNWGMEQSIGRQCLPLALQDAASTDNSHSNASQNAGDGFYYAVLQKTQ